VLDKSREYDGILLQLGRERKQIKNVYCCGERSPRYEKENQIKMLAAIVEAEGKSDKNACCCC